MARRKDNPKPAGTTTTTSTTSVQTSFTSMTSTAPQDVLWPEDAPYNADVKNIRQRLPVDTALFLSAESIEKVAEIDENVLRYWVRYRSRPESKQFFAKLRLWMIHLCTGRPEIPTPPLESDPVALMKWFADLKAAINRTPQRGFRRRRAVLPRKAALARRQGARI